ncbi:hypothetical protein [Metabacillus fastidiosus]|uniref:hypothetical protein n=1 Tax=Metabacillus fastidiosus TaxID=1458 RepID=UPI002E20C1D1|nr:hypothetical protein [Metabacillus fastidiosus]
MEQQIYFTDDELAMLWKCVNHIDSSDFDEGEKEPLLLESLDNKIWKAMKSNDKS